MSGLNESHKSRVRNTFAYMDEQLAEALSNLDPTKAHSPFSRYILDATPIQRRVLTDYVARLRAVILEIVERHAIALPPPNIRSTWAFRTALALIRVTIEELRPQYMRGYGELSEEAAADLEAVASQLIEICDRMDTYLAQGAAGELRTRLERLEGTRGGVGLARELERVITAHGLVGFRAALKMLVERLESPALEIAVFGRVNSGKSSLLNHVLRTAALPVGVTPVTAVPTRIVYGEEPGARIWFADSPAQDVPLEEIAEFAAEQRNPANSKHVSRIEVAIPATMLSTSPH